MIIKIYKSFETFIMSWNEIILCKFENIKNISYNIINLNWNILLLLMYERNFIYVYIILYKLNGINIKLG